MAESLWEDNLLERKVEGDLRDLLKTLVAFANTVRPGHTAVILIGERDDGTVGGVTNPDNIQRKVRETADLIYPPIVWRSTVYERSGKSCVRVEIDYSGETPHFGGTAWIRRGSSTVKAPDEVFQRLIATRSSIVRELELWVGKNVTLHGDATGVPPDRELTEVMRTIEIHHHRWRPPRSVLLEKVNQFYITVLTDNGERYSEPLPMLTVSYDDKRDQLKIIVRYY